MVPAVDFIEYATLALELHCLIWWHVWEDGSFQPYLMPVDDKTWRQIMQ